MNEGNRDGLPDLDEQIRLLSGGEPAKEDKAPEENIYLQRYQGPAVDEETIEPVREIPGAGSQTEQNTETDQGAQGEEIPQTEQIPQAVQTPKTEQLSEEQENSKKNSRAAVVIMGVLFVLLIGLSIYLAQILSKEIDTRRKSDKAYESDSKDPWKDILGQDDKDDKDSSKGGSDKKDAPKDDKKEKRKDEEVKPSIPDRDQDDSSRQDPKSDGEFSERDFINWNDDSWKDYVNHSASEYDGAEYYEEFADCIDENLSYQVVRQFETNYDKDLGVCLRTSYVQLEGDIPNLQTINETLCSKGCYYLDYYKESRDSIEEYLRNNPNATYLATTRCYVPYTSEDTISVIYQDDAYLAGERGFFLTCVNINLTTGTILDNEELIQLPDDFGEEFVRRSEAQNGKSAGTEYYNGDQILEKLRDKNSQIVFFSPVGLELGFEYQEAEISGWLTISLRDYQRYMKGV